MIRVRDFDEADKVVTLLTRDEGKVQAVARGARRPRSRYAAATQLFTHCQVAMYHGRNLETLSQIEIVDSFRFLREDLVRMAYATYMMELVDETVKEKQRQEALFLLLLTTLHLLGSDTDPEPLLHAFELKLLTLLGFKPQLDACVHCGEPVEGTEIRFSPGLGGVLGPSCPSEGESVTRISRGALETMRRLQSGDLRRTHVIQVSPGTAAEIAHVLDSYIELRTERRLRSLEFLHQVVPRA